MEEKAYKEGDLVKIRTNKHSVHLMEMFGHCQFHPDEISASEYVARIRSVIGNGACYSMILFTSVGKCYDIIDKDEILGMASADDLAKNGVDGAEWRNPVDRICYKIPDEAMPVGLTDNAKRLSLVIAAVEKLHPNEMIRMVEMSPNQSFLRSAIYDKVDKAINDNSLSAERREQMKERTDGFIRWAETLCFEEHYEYHVGVDKSNNEVHKEPDLSYYMVAVNANGSKAYVMETGNDQCLFYDYLGPDFQNLSLELFHLLH